MTAAIAARPNAGLHPYHRLAASVAGYGLEGFKTEAPSSPPGRDWRMFAAELVDQRLTGLAVAAARDGWLPLEDEQATDLLERHRGAMTWALSIERMLMAIDEAFADADIEYLVLKGSALAQTVYSDPSLRPFADLDLLIRGAHWERACALLPSLGLSRQHPESRRGFVDAFGKAAVHVDGAGPELDLHRRLVVGPHGLCADPDELFEDPVWFRLGGRWLRTLDDGLLFLHACMHAALGHRTPRLLPLRDVLQVAETGAIDWDLVAERARRWRLRAVIGYAVRSAENLLGVRPPEEAARLAASLVPSRRERRWLRAYTTERRFRGGTTVSTLSAIPGVRAKASYAAALLFPSREFVDARTSSRGVASYLARWRVVFRWLRGRRRPV
ncbi:MAG: nucleotidyltransferase family protein [Actinomycetota bacterium]